MHINKTELKGVNYRYADGISDPMPTNNWEVVCADGEILPCKNEGAAIIELDRLKQLGRAAVLRKRPKLES